MLRVTEEAVRMFRGELPSDGPGTAIRIYINREPGPGPYRNLVSNSAQVVKLPAGNPAIFYEMISQPHEGDVEAKAVGLDVYVAADLAVALAEVVGGAVLDRTTQEGYGYPAIQREPYAGVRRLEDDVADLMNTKGLTRVEAQRQVMKRARGGAEPTRRKLP